MKPQELTEQEKKRRFWKAGILPFFGLREELKIMNEWLVNKDIRDRSFAMVFGQFRCFAMCMQRLLPGDRKFRAFFTQVAYATAIRISRLEDEEIYCELMDVKTSKWFNGMLHKMNQEIIARNPDMPRNWLSKIRKTSQDNRALETVPQPK